jgi:hypothetical protein
MGHSSGNNLPPAVGSGVTLPPLTGQSDLKRVRSFKYNIGRYNSAGFVPNPATPPRAEDLCGGNRRMRVSMR